MNDEVEHVSSMSKTFRPWTDRKVQKFHAERRSSLISSVIVSSELRASSAQKKELLASQPCYCVLRRYTDLFSLVVNIFGNGSPTTDG
jgi:hypothetical protein